LRDVFRSVFSVLRAINAPIDAIAIEQLRHAVEQAIAPPDQKPNGQEATGCIAGKNIYQIQLCLFQNQTRPKTEPMNEKQRSKPPQPKGGQTIEDVKARGIIQSSDAPGDDQIIRRGEAEKDIKQKKGAAPAIFLPWGRATGLGIVALVLIFIVWLIFKYFSGS